MRIITGDECGLLKETIPELCRPKQQEQHSSKVLPSTQEGVRRVDPNEQQRRVRGVVDMAFTSSSPPDDDDNDTMSFAALRANGSVQLWESTALSSEKAFGTYQCTGVLNNAFESAANDSYGESSNETPRQTGRPIALDSLVNKNRICAADSLGNISIVNTETAHAPSVVAYYSPFGKQAQHNSTLSYTKGSYQNTNICTAMAVDSRGERAAIGGRERETCLLDIETGDLAWKAKNLPPDPQTLLQQPIWSTCLLFLDSSATFAGSNHVMAAGTAFKQVRLYDVRTNSKTKRPIAYTPEGLLLHRVTALCQVDSNQLVVGDAAGYLYSLDMRTLGKKRKGHLNLARFVGPAGSIRQVVKHSTLPIIATVGLDRMLRTYHTTTRKQLDCAYMKQRLNCLLFCNDETWTPGEESRSNVVEEEDVGGGALNADDEVQDYVDSSGDEDDSSEEEEESGSDEDLSDEDDSQESESESGDDSGDDDEAEVESRPRHVSKKRRV